MRFYKTAIIFLFVCCFPIAVHSESVMYGYDSSETLYLVTNPQTTTTGSACFPTISNAHMEVTYNVRAIDVATGASVCGATIPTGTRVSFEFIPHVSDDIYWFATGHSWDSPYGDWRDTLPQYITRADVCRPKNRYSDVAGGHYASLSLLPPVKHLSQTSLF